MGSPVDRRPVPTEARATRPTPTVAEGITPSSERDEGWRRSGRGRPVGHHRHRRQPPELALLPPRHPREFVWAPDQIIQLFDSLLRHDPISTFLFWELKPEDRDKWEIDRFIEHFRQGGTHDEFASTAGVQPLNLVLDGQQRLTSLQIGLKGSSTIRRR